MASPYYQAATLAAQLGHPEPAGRAPNGKPQYRIPCPAHNGKDRNLALWDGDGGNVAAKCWKSPGCSYQDILDALGIEFVYQGRESKRLDGTSVKRRRGPGKDLTGNPGSPKDVLVQVGREDAEENAVALVEGEKAADGLTLHMIEDVTAAHWIGGSGGVDVADYSPLYGRHVILWPDAGPDGRALMDKAAQKVRDIAASVKIVDVSTLREKMDAADVDSATAKDILNSATPYPYAVSELHEWMNSRHAGDEVRTAEALLAHCGHRLMILSRVVQDKHSIARMESATYYLDSRGFWREDSTSLKVEITDLLKRLKSESWALPPLIPYVGGNAVRGQLKRLADKPDKVSGHIPTVAVLAKQERNGAWWDKVTFAVERDLDASPRYLGTATGVVDLATGQLLTASEARSHFISRATPVAFHADSTHEDIEKLTEHLPADIAEYLWAVVGRSMWGDPPKEFYVIKSPPDSGKTSFFGAIGRALGPEGGPFSSDLLRPSRTSEGKAGTTPERAPLFDRRLIWGPEAEGWSFSAAKIKAMAGAEDELTHQPKFRPEESYKVRASMYLLCNEYPALPLDDAGVAARARIIDYKKPEQEDKTLIHRVRHEPQREAMLAKLVRYATLYPVEKVVEIPGTVAERTQARVDAARGAFGVWLSTAFCHSPGARLSVSDLWAAWACHNGMDPENKEIGGVQRAAGLSSLVRKVTNLAGEEPRPLWIDGRTQRGYLDRALAMRRCPLCKTVVPAAELVDDGSDGWGATCMVCRGEDLDGPPPGAEVGGDVQGDLEGMPIPASNQNHLVRLVQSAAAEAVTLYRERVTAHDAAMKTFDGPAKGDAGRVTSSKMAMSSWNLLTEALQSNASTLPPAAVMTLGGGDKVVAMFRSVIDRHDYTVFGVDAWTVMLRALREMAVTATEDLSQKAPALLTAVAAAQLHPKLQL